MRRRHLLHGPQQTVSCALPAAIRLASLAVFLVFHLSAHADTNGAKGAAPTPVPHYIGRQACVACHQPEITRWEGSDHDRSMDVATPETVLGDFNNTTFTYFNVTTRFLRRDNKYFVLTDGPDGSEKEYEVKYVFGYYPLQQYLLDFGNGAYQALQICWDTRPREQGGQRWFHLHPNEQIRFNDPLHWTKRLQTWNYSCAECHSTDLKKNFDEKSGRYTTTWAEIDVSCETCHGPASNHVQWAADHPRGSTGAAGPADSTMGLVHRFEKMATRAWEFGDSGTAKLKQPSTANKDQVEACARCHSRRTQISPDYLPGRSLLDTHRPELLIDEVYYADGQIKDEDYEYGSFLQSKMYRAGVACTDCHDPHSTRRFAEGNGVCTKCHLAPKYDTPDHHFHKQGSTGASCVACHAPRTAYMGVDLRADHSFRIPRPDLTEETGAPDACSRCHYDKPLEWSRNEFFKSYGQRGYPKDSRKPHYGQIFQGARRGKPASAEPLRALANDATISPIVRATAVQLLGMYPGDRFTADIDRAAHSEEGLVRYGAARALSGLTPQGRLRTGVALTNDPLLAVRLEAAEALSPFIAERTALAGSVSSSGLASFDRALTEYERALEFNSDTASALAGRANLAIFRGDFSNAEALLRRGIALEPFLQLPYVNLSDLYRSMGKDTEGEGILSEASSRIADSAEVKFALALTFVRQGRPSAALPLLAEAARMRPNAGHIHYVYAVALNSAGKPGESETVISRALSREPYDPELLQLGAMLDIQSGRRASAASRLRLLLELDPQNESFRSLYQQLGLHLSPSPSASQKGEQPR